MSTYNLTKVRAQIDELDSEIQSLITQRAHLAQAVARAKYAEEENPNFYRPEREAEVLRQVVARNQGPLPHRVLVQVFREIMSGCLALQKPLHIAFLGPEGTYSQAAVLKHFGHNVKTVLLQTIEEVFQAVEADSVQYGVVPIENSTEGGVNQTLDCFISTPLKICGEVELPIHHHLLSMANDLKQITRIYSHQQSLAQCRVWLNTHLPSVECIAVNSNAEAAQRATQEAKSAAIAGQEAANQYQLHILASHIEDHSNNTTRFAVLGAQTVPSTGCDKTSLLLSHANKPGALYHLLEPFSQQALNMTRIESRPSRQGMWQYVFFIDVEGHIQDTAVANALDTLKSRHAFVKHLGSYPRVVA